MADFKELNSEYNRLFVESRDVHKNHAGSGGPAMRNFDECCAQECRDHRRKLSAAREAYLLERLEKGC